MKKLKNKTVSMKLIEYTRGEEIENILHDLYINKELSIRQISDELGIHYHTVNKWLKLVGINMRLPQEKMLELIEIKSRLRESVNEK